MPLHAKRWQYKAIQHFKKKVLKPFVDQIHQGYEDILNHRLKHGFRRKNTAQVRETIMECVQGLDEDKPLRKLIDIFIVIYDSDDAYAFMFHQFVEKCNNHELVLKADGTAEGNYLYEYERGSPEWFENEYEEQLKMADDRLKEMKARKRSIQRKRDNAKKKNIINKKNNDR